MANDAEIQQLIYQADAAPLRSPGKGALLEDAVRRADALGLKQLALAARQDLAVHYATLGLPDQAFALFGRSLAEIDAYPDQFAAGADWQVLSWYLRIVHQLSEFPEVSRQQIEAALADLESRAVSRGFDQAALFGARRKVAQTMGDWDAEERAHRSWVVAGGGRPGNPRDLAVEVQRLILRNDPALVPDALELAMPTLTSSDFAVEVRSLTLFGLLQAGQTGLVARSYRIGLGELHRDGTHYVEIGANYIRFAGLTGNSDRGLDSLGSYLKTYRTMSRPTGKVELAAAIQSLLTPLVRSGRGAELIHVCGSADHLSLAEVLADATATVARLTAEFDARNGNSNFGDRIREVASTYRPLVKYLPLPTLIRCTEQPPLPPGLSAEQLVVTASWFADRDEQTQADRYLAAITQVPDHLIPKLTELRARSAWDKTAADAFTAAEKAYTALGDVSGRLLCQAWSAAHLASTSPRMGTTLLRVARNEAAKFNCAEAVAVAEWLAAFEYRSRGAKHHQKAYECLARAVEAGSGAATTLWLGRAKFAELSWLREDGRHREAVAAGLVAKDQLRSAGAIRLTHRAYELLGLTLLDLGAYDQLVVLAEQDLAVLPSNAPVRIRATLQGLRGTGLVWLGRAGEALDDLLSATAEERANGFDGYRRRYELAVALADHGSTSHAFLEIQEATEWAEQECGGDTAVETYFGAGLAVAILELYAHTALQEGLVKEAVWARQLLVNTCPDPAVKQRNQQALVSLSTAI
jgi:hypothetical protein